MKVIELRQHCKARQLSTAGNKRDLIVRLKLAGFQDTEDTMDSGGACASEVNAEDSVSQASSHSSVSSRAKLAARRASLEVKARYLEKQQELQYSLEKEKWRGNLKK